MAELQARGLAVDRTAPGSRRAAVRALAEVDLSIERGELVAVMGGTGAGKSTLALALAGVLEPAAGSVTGIGDVRLVLQRPEASFLEERVLDEVSLAARIRGEPRAHAERRALETLAQLGLPADVAGRDPLALSGGEQRRVAIAAVLADQPAVTILDEPGAGLDAAARDELHASVRRLHATGRTLVVITHDPVEAERLATRLVVLDRGRVAFDGPLAAVLGDPGRAAALGLQVAPEVQVLHDLAASRSVALGATPASPEAALAELARVLRAPAVEAPASLPQGAHEAAAPAAPAVALLPPLVDARVRLAGCALAVAAALLAGSLLAAAIVAGAAALVVAGARIDRARVRLAVRPLVALAVLLVALQLLVGGDTSTELRRGVTSDAPALAALLRALQASAVVLATLALSASTATADLAAALRGALGPLRLLRVPVGSLSFVLATGLGLVPTLADELERLRMAQRARGLRPPTLGVAGRLRADARLLTPLFVAAFRRAHLLADALAVRGFDPDARIHPWRARRTPPADLLLLAGGVLLVGVSRFV